MVHQNFAVLAKLGFCSECSQNFSGHMFSQGCIFSQVLARLVFFFLGGGVAFLKVLVNACACKEKRCACMLTKTIRYPWLTCNIYNHHQTLSTTGTLHPG